MKNEKIVREKTPQRTVGEARTVAELANADGVLFARRIDARNWLGKPQYRLKFKWRTFNVRAVRSAGLSFSVERPMTTLKSSEDIYLHLQGIFAELDRDKEHFVLIGLSSKNHVIGYKLISTGTLTATLVRPREVYRSALILCADTVLFAHNHPSGDPSPSPEDIEVTKTLEQAGALLNIRVKDHVVCGDGRWFSFADRGMLDGNAIAKVSAISQSKEISKARRRLNASDRKLIQDCKRLLDSGNDATRSSVRKIVDRAWAMTNARKKI